MSLDYWSPDREATRVLIKSLRTELVQEIDRNIRLRKRISNLPVHSVKELGFVEKGEKVSRTVRYVSYNDLMDAMWEDDDGEK